MARGKTGQRPQVGLSLMLEPEFWQAAEPLFEAGAVEVLEWSFDTAWGGRFMPGWARQLLQQFSQRNGLLGHGVSYSLLSAELDRSRWLAGLAAECRDYGYRQVSEHFGWCASRSFRDGAPLSMPLLPETLRVGVTSLQRFAEVAQVPVGLENLAFAFSLEDVRQQGDFMAQLLEPVDGFLLLDLHNLYCQICNFQISAAELLALYPLHRVRELHVSGGSWSQGPGGRIRRDTHDQAVPEPVFELLALALERCPGVEAVIFERLGHSLGGIDEQFRFRFDFARVQSIVEQADFSFVAVGAGVYAGA
jgi:uncharacterized protein